MTESAEHPQDPGDDTASEQPAPATAAPDTSAPQDGADEESARAVSPARPTQPWVLGTLGGIALGLSINALNDAFPGAFLPAVAVVLLLVVSAAYQLRRRPAGALIHTLLPRVTLPLAAVAAVVSLFFTGTAAAWAVLLAAALGVTGCLRPGPIGGLFEQLRDVAVIAIGAAMTGIGVGFLLDSRVLLGVAEIAALVALVAAGVAMIGLGVSLLLDSRVLLGVALIVLGVAVIGVGVSHLLAARALIGVAGIAFGVASIGAGVNVVDGGRVVGWFRSLLAAPPEEPGTGLQQEREGQWRTAGPESGPPPG